MIGYLAGYLNERVNMNVCGSFVTTSLKNKYLLVICDTFPSTLWQFRFETHALRLPVMPLFETGVIRLVTQPKSTLTEDRTLRTNVWMTAADEHRR